MNDQEINKLQEYVKKRFDDCNMDYKTFDADLDNTLTFQEQKAIFDEMLLDILPREIPKLKRETTMTIQQLKAEQEAFARAEQEKQEAELKIEREKEFERIKNMPVSVEQERLYFELDGLLAQVINNQDTRGLIVEGETSLGKTFRVKKNLTKYNLIEGKDYEIHSGHTTTLRFYIKLYNSRDKIHIFDDESILNNKTNLNMIKAILNGNNKGVVEYDTSKKLPDNVPNRFDFTGKVIILLNKMPSNDEHLKAVESRVLNYKLVIPYIEKLKLLYDIAKKTAVTGTTEKERLDIVDWIKANTNESTQNLNIRLYEHCIYFYIQNKEIWKELAITQIKNDGYSMLILQGLKEKEWCNQTGLGRSSYFSYKKRVGK